MDGTCPKLEDDSLRVEHCTDVLVELAFDLRTLVAGVHACTEVTTMRICISARRPQRRSAELSGSGVSSCCH